MRPLLPLPCKAAAPKGPAFLFLKLLLATYPFPRFLQARPARKLRLTDPKCSSAATQISPTRLKPHKLTVFDTDPLQCVFWRISQRNSVVIDLKLCLRPKAGRKKSLATNVASRPKGTFWAFKQAHMGTTAYVLDAQIGAQNPQLVGSQVEPILSMFSF